MKPVVKPLAAAVICPGRGTYNSPELGYLSRYHADKKALLAIIDDWRRSQGQPSVSELDGAPRYQMAVHNVGENVSALIYACAVADYQDIDRERFEIVAVTGNSMGWYLALACAGALQPRAGIEVVNTMGSMMRKGVIGGQLVYPLVDEHWCEVPGRRQRLLELIQGIHGHDGAQLYLSIRLGGLWVFGGNEAGLGQLQQQLPVQDRYPMRLPNHAAFHTPLLDGVVDRARQALPQALFEAPGVPLVDGRGHIWQPWSTDAVELRDYTLGEQINHCYDFSKAVEVLIKEFAPDVLIIPGPGATLGGAVAQELISHRWLGMTSKQDFQDRQRSDPFVLAMGLDDQRRRATGK